MREYYRLLDAMAKKAGGPYRLSSILIKRVRQLVKGSLSAFRAEGFDPVSAAFEEYNKELLEVTEGGAPPELFQEKGKKKK